MARFIKLLRLSITEVELTLCGYKSTPISQLYPVLFVFRTQFLSASSLQPKA
jgi:hypothetical protein